MEVMEAHLAQIDRVNPVVNAIVTYHPDQALDNARTADEAIAKNKPIGPLFGLPIAHKDLVSTKGVRTTFGSPIFRDFVPDQDELIVERLKKAGAISVGKTNVPEFGAGSQTFNPVFGATLNPYDTTRTCGGSSGGAGVALACGMLPIADGSDMGGSLRNPASFCNVVGYRPSIGRQPNGKGFGWYGRLSTTGPMARTVSDTVYLMASIGGPDKQDPLTLPEDGNQFLELLNTPIDMSTVKVAYCPDLHGLPIDPEVRQIISNAAGIFLSLIHI